MAINPSRWQGIRTATLEKTPIGPVGVAVSNLGLVGVTFGRADFVPAWQSSGTNLALLDQAYVELEEYLGGQRKEFSLPLDWTGIPAFQRAALEYCAAIPFGQIITYGRLAAQLGKPGAAIAVGGAMAANPMPLVVPCHRVVGSDRRLHGFGAPEGIRTKAYLLKLEGHQMDGDRVIAPLGQLSLFGGETLETAHG